MLRFGVMGADTEFRADDGDLLLGVEQKLPLFGKPQAARKVARTELSAQWAETDYRVQQLRREIIAQLVKLSLAQRLAELSRLDLTWLDTMVTTMEEKYRNGMASQFELLQIQNERARRTTALRTQENNADYESVALNRVISRPLSNAWPKVVLPPAAEPLPPTPELLEHAIANAPKLRVMHRMAAVADAMAEATKKERLPGFAVGAETRNYSRDAEFRQSMFTLSFNIPWGNRDKYRSDYLRDKAKAEAVKLDVASEELALRDEISRLAVQIDAARREALLYQSDVIPRSEQALASAHSTWLANRGMFRDVLDARRMLIEAQTMQARAVTEQHSMLAELVLHCGLSHVETLEPARPAPAETPAERKIE
jgi:outer membrane protein TolC